MSADLEARLARLEHGLGIQQDIEAIRKLQYTYGYFIDKSQYSEVVDLFAEDGEVWFLGGVYKARRAFAGSISSASRPSSPRDTTGRAMAGCSTIRRCRW
ncbi:MAG: nuclear transport factor 2 family protein [Qipengyuania sp.]|nr:nuclear transport factor 2 family protein [Qipengyuania sp.]